MAKNAKNSKFGGPLPHIGAQLEMAAQLKGAAQLEMGAARDGSLHWREDTGRAGDSRVSQSHFRRMSAERDRG